MKKVTGILLILAVIAASVGCAKGEKVKETTLYIEDNGKVKEAIVDKDKNVNVSEKELTKWVDEAIEEYNKENKNALEVTQCEVEDNTVRVSIEYASLKDYSAFNNVKAFDGTVADAKKAGFEMAGEFLSTKGKPSITYAELEDSKEYHLIIIEDPQTLVLEEDVLYASSNVKVEKNKAIIESGTKELAYMIYKP